MLNRNPCTPLGLIKPEWEECVWLEFSAAELLLKHLDAWHVLLVTFLLATGIRWGEAAARKQRKDAKHVWGRGRTKTDAGRRRITLTQGIRAALPLEIPEIRPHAFRHTHAAWLLSAGVPEGEVQRRLGHADPLTTKRLCGHMTREASKATLRFLEVQFAPLKVIGRGAVVNAAEDSRLDEVDKIDAALPLVDDEDEEQVA